METTMDERRDADFREQVLQCLARLEQKLDAAVRAVDRHDTELEDLRAALAAHIAGCPLTRRVEGLEIGAAERQAALREQTTWRSVIGPALWLLFVMVLLLILIHSKELLPHLGAMVR